MTLQNQFEQDLKSFSEADDYTLLYLASHLQESGYQDRLHHLLLNNPAWMQAKFKRFSGDTEYLSDLELAIQNIESQNATKIPPNYFGLITARQVVRTRASEYSDTNLAAMVLLGRHEQAIKLALLRTERIQRCKSLLFVAETMSRIGKNCSDVLDVVHLEVRSIENPKIKCEFSRSLAILWNSLGENNISKQTLIEAVRFSSEVDDSNERRIEHDELIITCIEVNFFTLAKIISHITPESNLSYTTFNVSLSDEKNASLNVDEFIESVLNRFEHTPDKAKQLLLKRRACLGIMISGFGSDLQMFIKENQIADCNLILFDIVTLLVSQKSFSEAKIYAYKISNISIRITAMIAIIELEFDIQWLEEILVLLRKQESITQKVKSLNYLISVLPNDKKELVINILKGTWRETLNLSEPELQTPLLRMLIGSIQSFTTISIGSMIKEAIKIAQKITEEEAKVSEICLLVVELHRHNEEGSHLLINYVYEIARNIDCPRPWYKKIDALCRVAVSMITCDFPQALDVFREALDWSRVVLDFFPSDYPVVIGKFAEDLLDAGHLKLALEAINQLKYSKEAYSRISSNLVSKLLECKEFETAIDIVSNIPLSSIKAQNLILSSIHLVNKDLELANTLFDEAVELLQVEERTDFTKDMLLSLASALFYLEDSSLGFVHSEVISFLKQSTSSETSLLSDTDELMRLKSFRDFVVILLEFEQYEKAIEVIRQLNHQVEAASILFVTIGYLSVKKKFRTARTLFNNFNDVISEPDIGRMATLEAAFWLTDTHTNQTIDALRRAAYLVILEARSDIRAVFVKRKVQKVIEEIDNETAQDRVRILLSTAYAELGLFTFAQEFADKIFNIQFRETVSDVIQSLSSGKRQLTYKKKINLLNFDWLGHPISDLQPYFPDLIRSINQSDPDESFFSFLIMIVAFYSNQNQNELSRNDKLSSIREVIRISGWRVKYWEKFYNSLPSLS